MTALKPGDQIVLLDEDAHPLFSEQRMAALDAGVLKEQSQRRIAWLALVRAVAEEKKLTPAAIAQGMAARGHCVTVAAVSRWLAERAEEAHAPLRVDSFLALADVLGVQLPAEVLHLYYLTNEVGVRTPQSRAVISLTAARR